MFQKKSNPYATNGDLMVISRENSVKQHPQQIRECFRPEGISFRCHKPSTRIINLRSNKDSKHIDGAYLHPGHICESYCFIPVISTVELFCDLTFLITTLHPKHPSNRISSSFPCLQANRIPPSIFQFYQQDISSSCCEDSSGDHELIPWVGYQGSWYPYRHPKQQLKKNTHHDFNNKKWLNKNPCGSKRNQTSFLIWKGV